MAHGLSATRVYAGARGGVIGADAATYAKAVRYPAYAWMVLTVFVALRVALERRVHVTALMALASVALVLTIGAPLRELHEKELLGRRTRQVVMKPAASDPPAVAMPSETLRPCSSS